MHRWPARFSGFLIVWSAFAVCFVARAADSQPVGHNAELAHFFERHCVRCHGAEKAEADVRFGPLAEQLAPPEEVVRWRKILKRLQAEEMPPEGEPQPSRQEIARATRQITALLDEAAARRRQEGRVVLRRLNRVAYENTVRELFDVQVDVKEMLPEDGIAHGFDNIGAALNVSPVLMERYLEAADAAISAAIAPIATAESSTERFDLFDSLPAYFHRAVYRRDDGVVLFRTGGSATALNEFRSPVAGRYRFRVSIYGYQSDAPVPFAVLAGNFRTAAGSARHVGYFDAPPRAAGIIEFEAHLENARETIKIQPVDLPHTYVRPEAMPDYPGPGLCVQWIEATGPLPQQWPTPGFRRVFGDIDPRRATLADAQSLLREFVPRAFRRPASDEELQPYLDLVATSLESGQSFEQALRAGLKGVLCSPQFLYLKESPGALDDYALASRLSYFLWSGPPDVALLDLASRSELRRPKVLREQVERMLAHPKAKAFTQNFVGQWLGLREIKSTTPDKQLYPEFDELLEWSMVQETELFFEELLKHDRSVLNFVDSDFTMLNGRLARHYAVEGVEGVAMRRFPLRPEHHRGGVLTHASVLKVTANGTTTSPVARGVWILDRIMGQPVSPPPANVPAIEPDIRGATTIREQLARHRQIASCASCHVHIDPPGFALENYDVIGGWREHYRALGVRQRALLPATPLSKYLAKPQYGDGPKVEAGDVLADGRKFSDLAEFKRLLLSDPDQIARCITEKLMIYATGHGLEYGDQGAIEEIIAETRKAGYGLRSIVHAIVQSEMFRTK